MEDLIAICYDNMERPTVSGRELHGFLNIETPYAKWFGRMAEYGFVEGEDYATVDKNVLRADGTKMPQTQHDHQLTIPMAKELCMIQRNDKGKQARRYFLKIEEAWNSPEQIMKRALEIANRNVEKMKERVFRLEEENTTLKPKAQYFDAVIDRNLLTNFRTFASELHIKQTVLVQFLLDKKYLYRDTQGKLKPYAERNTGLFEVKEFVNHGNGHTGTQTLITPKGRETFRLLLEAEGLIGMPDDTEDMADVD